MTIIRGQDKVQDIDSTGDTKIPLSLMKPSDLNPADSVVEKPFKEGRLRGSDYSQHQPEKKEKDYENEKKKFEEIQKNYGTVNNSDVFDLISVFYSVSRRIKIGKTW